MAPFCGFSTQIAVLHRALQSIRHAVTSACTQDPKHLDTPDHNLTTIWLPKSQLQLVPVLQEFQEIIESDPHIYMCFHQMFEQIPTKPPYDVDPGTFKPQIRDYKTFLRVLNIIITQAPEFYTGPGSDNVGTPINAILIWPMATDAGISAFLNDKVNFQLRKVLQEYGAFLSSPGSCNCLTTADNGWLSPAAMALMPNFVESFRCNPKKPHFGFTSWDDFFTREFRPGVRPVQFPHDDSIINSACESQVYKIAFNVQLRDKFWIKDEPYSLSHMLNGDPVAQEFVGGTVFQSFLSSLKYHRWHSPVNGTIQRIIHIPGSYYAASPAQGFRNPSGPDPSAANLSQGFITTVATRALIFIKVNSKKIGLMCFMAIGMGEVSSCEVTVRDGDKIKKGDQLGVFHFGGSSYCLIFRPDTKIRFYPEITVSSNLLLNSAIAAVIN
ncbi:hypothetical protein M422DRAFT_62290 [Sphaerobolus stellatus SS14]|uniref:L-tryptophan decarboxylase PsiD-like domain-containing protein n=1 Tax=Sphaerobolus stellatus (strain SS14) TaxID=990650 RepID=A0A0C9U7N2_SPHS4|nr:hypothetical protein M422DRAFT_62290 [Sphaerobolus stellatus SS14]